MGEAKRRKELGNYPEQTRKPVRKSKRQVEREVIGEIMNEFFPIPFYPRIPRRMRK